MKCGTHQPKTTRTQVELANEVAASYANARQLAVEGQTLFVINHSGGKDSQAMFILETKFLAELGVPKRNILVLHADLSEVEFAGTREHAETTTAGYEFQAVKHATGETLLTLAEKRGAWPSPTLRSCTSQLKSGPLDKAIRHALKARGLSKVVSCMGLRAEESSARSKQPVWKLDERNSKAGRQWFVWLPIFDLSESDVFSVIRAAGQQPHWAYGAGMTRLSCCFCVMASKSDLTTAAKLNPELYAKYVALEKRMGQTLLMPTKKNGRQFLEQVTGVKAV